MSVRQPAGRGCVFKSKGAIPQNRLTKKSRTEERRRGRGGHLAGYHRLASLLVLRSRPDVKVAPTVERPAFGSGGRARDRRTAERQTTMHDATTPASEIGDEQRAHLDCDLDRFGPVWTRDSKSEPPHGRGIILYLDYLDYSLERRRRDARASGRAGAQVAVPPMRENRPIRPNGRRPHRSHAICSWKAESKRVQRASKIVPNGGCSL
jgi:hypothetical protein